MSNANAARTNHANAPISATVASAGIVSAGRRQLTGRVAAAVGALAIVLVALFLFMNANTDRILAQNDQYLAGSTQQTARRVDDLLTNALSSIQSAAAVYEESLGTADVDPQQVLQHTHSTQFDYFFFTAPDGTAYTEDGRVANASGREYYQEGMRNESGICAVEDSAFDGTNIVIFYAPLHYQGQVVGIISGVYMESTLTSYITTYFFGEQTTTYLCDRTGGIVARSSVFEVKAANAFDVYDPNDLNNISLGELEQAFELGESVSFRYTSSSGQGSAYLMQLPSYDWMLLRTFPESITNTMLLNANRAGIILVAGVAVAAALFIVVLVLQARRQRRQLLLERQDATRIIDASTNLFSRLLSVDLVNDGYEYLKSDERVEGLPVQGSYRELRQRWLDTVASQDVETVQRATDPNTLRAELVPGVPFYQYEYRSERDGAEAWMQVSALCLARDGAGTPTDILVAVQDVTEAKAQELANRHALEEAFRAAEHASQAKSDFLNSMSHDIRTPMNSIMGMTAIASMHVDDTERVRECLGNITSASRHLLGLINEVLDMAKIESGSISLSEEAFDIPETVENLLAMVNPQISAKGQNLKVELAGIQHEHVVGDPTRLQQVFVNIMGNAIKFTPEGGTITFKIRELPSRIPDSGCYEFVFSDTGCGMSPEFMERLFEPFTRANDSRVTNIEGTGLGMSIVKSVVSLMNGDIDVESELDAGTTFTVTVHLKLRDGADEDLSDLAGVKVLVVDDDEVACEGACALLDDIGMQASWRTSGPEGVEAVRAADAESQPFQAVILDWRMPGMSGLEAARAIREAVRGNIPIIILSGYDWSMIEQEAREAGVDAFISKPLFRSRLIQVMKELVQGEAHDPDSEMTLLEDCAFDGRRILLTEDNPMAAEIAREILELTGAVVDHAQNGKVALDMLTESGPGTYDLVLMDIQMPVMNGYEATAAIREAGEERPDLAQIPIIALSADAFAEDVKHAGAAGMNAHLSKPLEIVPLARTLREWMPHG